MASFVPQFPFVKGQILSALDQLSVAPGARSNLEALARALHNIASNDFQDFGAVIDQFLFAPLRLEQSRSAVSMQHIRDQWLDPASPTTYFPDDQPIAPTFAGGMLVAVERSLADAPDPRPIDSWWIMNHRKFEVITLVSPRQVTMLLCTPPPRGVPPSGIWHPEAEGYVTGHHGVVTRRYRQPQ